MSLRTRSFAEFDRPYRRGVVLGLSLAELFLILLFLLLLATIGYSAVVQEKLDEAKVVSSKLEDTQKALGLAQAANVQLAGDKSDAVARTEAAEQERDQLARELAQTEELLGNLIDAEDPQNLIAGLAKGNRELTAKMDQLTPAAELGDKVREAARQADVDPSDVPDMVSDMKQTHNTLEDYQALLGDAQKARDVAEAKLGQRTPAANLGDKVREAARQAGVDPSDVPDMVADMERRKKDHDNLKGKFLALAQDKGQFPPCWYKNVAGPGDKMRERGLYIFHVRISDDSVFVKDIPAPTTEYAIQKVTLPFERRALNKNLRFYEFVTSFKPLSDAGENQEVQAYPCKFYVKVWAATTSQDSYRHALENVVESVFFTYTVKEDPWPHQKTAQTER